MKDQQDPQTQMNPGKGGPKGALAEAPADGPPKSGPPGNEGNNTRRDFVQLPKDRKRKTGRD